MGDWKLIVKVLGEGGSFTLMGRLRGQSEEFKIVADDMFLEEILEEDSKDWGDGDMNEVVVVEPTEPLTMKGWQEAVEGMRRRSFHRLYPGVIDTEYADRVWAFFASNGKNPNPFLMDAWREACFSHLPLIKQLVEWLKASASTVVLTGAGMSTESGVPDFRSSKGLWKTHDPRQLASTEALEYHYDDFRAFYKSRIEGLADCTPHVGHQILASWEQNGVIDAVATQNVDRFHQMAGSKNVYELHGNIRTVRCQECGSVADVQAFLDGESCAKCDGRLRPNVVLFGEMLPETDWRLAVKAIQKAELVLVIGTSLEVYPANQLPQMTRGKVVLINKEKTGSDGKCDMVIHDAAGKVLRLANEYLR